MTTTLVLRALVLACFSLGVLTAGYLWGELDGRSGPTRRQGGAGHRGWSRLRRVRRPARGVRGAPVPRRRRHRHWRHALAIAATYARALLSRGGSDVRIVAAGSGREAAEVLAVQLRGCAKPGAEGPVQCLGVADAEPPGDAADSGVGRFERRRRAAPTRSWQAVDTNTENRLCLVGWGRFELPTSASRSLSDRTEAVEGGRVRRWALACERARTVRVGRQRGVDAGCVVTRSFKGRSAGQAVRWAP